MKLIREKMSMPFGLPAPEWLLKIGALIIGTETELILKSRWVYPRHLLEQGFSFRFPKPEEALADILGT
jgi:NAD dependent epimerase/dehydratase family enzyme